VVPRRAARVGSPVDKTLGGPTKTMSDGAASTHPGPLVVRFSPTGAFDMRHIRAIKRYSQRLNNMSLIAIGDGSCNVLFRESGEAYANVVTAWRENDRDGMEHELGKHGALFVSESDEYRQAPITF